MILGTALVLAALSLFFWNRWEDRQAGEVAGDILLRIIEKIQQPDDDGEPSYPDPYDPAMTELEIDGYAYIGCLSIPAIELELPVMSEWDYTRLKIAPCRYTGSVKTNDFVIAGHNYTRHFGPLSDLSPGDQVLFTDMDGKVWVYQVAAVEVLAPTAVEDMTASGYDLTLFTCTYGGTSRATVRCERITEKKKTRRNVIRSNSRLWACGAKPCAFSYIIGKPLSR